MGRVEVYCPVDLIDLSEDVIVGRAILNRVRLELNGKLAKLLHIERMVVLISF